MHIWSAFNLFHFTFSRLSLNVIVATNVTKTIRRLIKFDVVVLEIKSVQIKWKAGFDTYVYLLQPFNRILLLSRICLRSIIGHAVE